jgi:hypothetical protein
MEFDAGLKTINTPYVHQETTAIKLIGTPEDELRTYDLRGWTLFESRVIDGKGTGTIPKAMGWLGLTAAFKATDFGSMNVLVVHEKIFPLHHGHSHSETSELLACCAQRSVPCKPDRFRGELEERRCSAEIKGQRLFTSGKDQPFVQDKYEATYKMMTQTTTWNCSNLRVNNKYCEDLAGVLKDWSLKNIDLQNNEIGADGAAALAKALEVNASITNIDLGGNKIGGVGAAALAKALEVNASITNFNLGFNQVGDDGAAALAKASKVNKSITIA